MALATNSKYKFTCIDKKRKRRQEMKADKYNAPYQGFKTNKEQTNPELLTLQHGQFDSKLNGIFSNNKEDAPC